MYNKELKRYVMLLHTRGQLPGVKGLLVVLTCGGYLAFSSQLVVLNKFLLQHDNFRYPLLLSNLGMLFTFLASTLCCRSGIVPRQKAISTREYVFRFAPLGFWTAASLGLGNVGALYLDMGLVEMMKGFNAVVVQALSFLLELEKFSWLPVLATSLIAAGTATTAATGVSSVSSFGLIVHLASHVCEALRVCLAQLHMCAHHLHQIETLRLMSSACAVFLMLGVACFEWGSFMEDRGWERILAHPHWYLAAASLGFCVNLSAYCVIKLAGSITQKVLGTIKNVMLVVLSVCVMGEHVSGRQWLGYQLSLAGFLWYQYLKFSAPTAAAQPDESKKKSR